MYAQKLEAIKTRTKGRDLFDLAYLTHEYGNQISDAELARAEILTADFVSLAERYEITFQKDEILSALGNAEDTVLDFREAIECELNRRASVHDVDRTKGQVSPDEPTLG